MGDALTEEWENANEAVESEEELDEESIDPNKAEKLAKKKRKFAEMKEKRKQHQESNDAEADFEAMSTEDMMEIYVKNQPVPADCSGLVDRFYFPDVPNPTPSKRGFCPFVRALSAGLPNYKKILLGKSQVDGFGSPTVLILCSSALRATEIIKSISARLIKCKIAKLFAKHFKLQEQMDMLKTEHYPIAIGTPNRILKLMEVGSLHLQQTKIVLVDLTPDNKQFNILSLNDTKADIYSFFDNYISKDDSQCAAKVAFIRGVREEGKGKTKKQKS